MSSTPPSLPSIARRHWRLVALSAVAVLLAGVAVGLVRSPTYTATVQLNVGTLDARVQSVPGYVEAARSLASSYSRVATTDRVIAPVARDAGLTTEEVRERVTVTPVIQNPIITVEAEGSSEAAARDLAAGTAGALRAEVDRLDREGGAERELLDDFRAASRRLAAAETSLRTLERRREADAGAVSRARLERQQAEVETRRLESQTIGTLYSEARARSGSAASLQVIGAPAAIASDRSSAVQRLAFVGLLAGVAVGLALAAAREAAAGRRRRRSPATVTA